MRRTGGLLTALSVIVMAVFGYGVYRGLGHFKHTGTGSGGIAEVPTRPEDQHPALTTTGTIYLSQKGNLYALHGGSFTRLIGADQRGSWIQPTIVPDGRLVVVARTERSSDLYVVGEDGRVAGRLTNDVAGRRPSDSSLEFNHFAFHPRVSADGSRLLFDFDSPKCGFLFSLAIFGLALPAPGTPMPTPSPPAITQGCPNAAGAPPGARMESTPITYTPGDIEPIPLPDAALLFVRYILDPQGNVHSQLVYQRAPQAPAVALTDPAQDCGQPDLSPDATQIAMVCSGGPQTTIVSVAGLALPAGGPARLLPPRSVAQGCLCAFPTWSPDSRDLVYLAPLQSGGNFQLWLVRGAGGTTPGGPQALTDHLGLDATSRPAWRG